MWALGPGIHVFRTKLYRLLIVSIWKSQSPSLRLSFLIHKMEITIDPHQFCCSVRVRKILPPQLLIFHKWKRLPFHSRRASEIGEILLSPRVTLLTGPCIQWSITFKILPIQVSLPLWKYLFPKCLKGEIIDRTWHWLMDISWSLFCILISFLSHIHEYARKH